MVSVDLIAMVTSEASDGYERRLRAKRVMVTSEASNGRVQWHSYGGRFWSVLPHTAHFVIPVISLLWRKVLECSSSHCSLRHPCVLTLMEEVSGVFFLTLLTSSSLCSHSYGGSFWSVLPHTAHFVIPVISLTSSSLCPHSLRHPWVLTPMTCLLTHLIVIPDFSLESSHPSHPWLLTLTSLVLPLIPYSVFSHTPTLIALTQVISPSSLATHSHHLCYHAHSSPRSLSPHFSECSHPSLVFSHSPSHIECHHTHSHILLTCVTTLSDLTSLVFWESVCSHFHGVVLPPSLLSHCLLSHTLSHPCHPCEHFHGVVLPPSHHSLLWENLAPTHTPMVSYYHQVITHTHTNPCAPTHFISPPSRYKCITNHLPHSPTHHASITSSSPHHLFLSPITTNRFLSLHTTLLTPPFHSQPSQSSPKSSPISIHTHNDNSRTP